MFDVAIVADGNASIGIGHIMRCSAIAEALTETGYTVCYIVSDRDSAEIAAGLGYRFLCMDTDYRELHCQAEKIVNYIQEYGIRAVFFDSYFASDLLFEQISKKCIVGCFGYGKNYSKGMNFIVPYGVSSDKEWFERIAVQNGVRLLFGSKYVPLRAAFQGLKPKNGKKKPERLFLTCGGTDPLNIIPTLIDGIRESGTEIKIDVIIGQYMSEQKIRNSCRSIENIFFHQGLKDLFPLMKSADIAISAGGMTLYELMASSVPVIAYAFADNQLGNEKLGKAIVWCGDIRNNGKADESVLKKIVNEMNALINDENRRIQLINNGKNVCDGNGAVRIAGEIGELIRNTE